MTLCTKDRQPALTDPAVGDTAFHVLTEIHARADATIHAATLMPDHAHLPFTLGSRLRLGQIIAKFKSLTRHLGGTTWRWQDDGFERRLRHAESIEDYAFYIFMNPYRAQLLPVDRRWPWWFCPDETKLTFFLHLDSGDSVPHEWIEKSERIIPHRHA